MKTARLCKWIFGIAVFCILGLAPAVAHADGFEWVVEPRDDIQWMGGFSEGLAVLRLEHMQWGFMDASGEIVIEAPFNHAHNFSGGLARVEVGASFRDVRFGFINRSGEIVIPAELQGAQCFSEGFAAISYWDDDGQSIWGFIDKQGQWAIGPYTGGWIPNGFSNGVARIMVRDDEYFYINTQGQRVAAPQAQTPSPITGGIHFDFATYSEGVFFIGHIDTYREDQWVGILDMQGNITRIEGATQSFRIYAEGITVPGFSEGLVAFEAAGDNWPENGFANLQGQIVIAPQFWITHGFNGGLATVRTENGWGVISSPHAVVAAVVDVPYIPPASPETVPPSIVAQPPAETTPPSVVLPPPVTPPATLTPPAPPEVAPAPPVQEAPPTPAAVETPSAPASATLRVNTHALTLRSGAGNGYNPIGWLRAGDTVTEISRQGGWVQVETARGTGWVFGRYLAPIQ